jgi:hypothetical protein
MKRSICYLFLFSVPLLLVACSHNEPQKGNTAEIPAEGSAGITSGTGDSSSVCQTTPQQLDTLSEFQGKIIELEEDPENYTQITATVDQDYGIITYQNNTDSSSLLVFTKTIDPSVSKSKVLGVLKFPKASSAVTFQSLCNCTCKGQSEITGLIEVDMNDNTRTLKAWQVDKPNKRLLRMEATSVDCYDAYSADFD